jgi:hypothetical protein
VTASTGHWVRQRSPARFTTEDLLSILTTPTATTTTASETHSLQPGTAAWRNIGLTNTTDDSGDDRGDDASGGEVNP